MCRNPLYLVSILSCSSLPQQSNHCFSSSFLEVDSPFLVVFTFIYHQQGSIAFKSEELPGHKSSATLVRLKTAIWCLKNEQELHLLARSSLDRLINASFATARASSSRSPLNIYTNQSLLFFSSVQLLLSCLFTSTSQAYFEGPVELCQSLVPRLFIGLLCQRTASFQVSFSLFFSFAVLSFQI